MVKTPVAGFLMKFMIVLFFGVTVHSATVHAAANPPGDDAEFAEEMNLLVRRLDPVIYPDNQPNVSSPFTERLDASPMPSGETNERPLSETYTTPENDAIRIARPGDPELDYPIPSEPDSLFKEFLDVIGGLLGIGGLVKIGVVVALVLVGMRVFKRRKKTASIAEKQESTSFASALKRTATVSFERPDNIDSDQTQIRCTQCALVISEDHKFCTGCGALAPEAAEKKPQHPAQRSASYCASCGTELQLDVQFCTNCGKKV